ncbi:undecaprenyl-phosphate alpha-N-acetylglucosaminyl 1-phosphate transferase [Paenibacillus sp. J31TS4]|uniref:MraY family glycosyltransferase n=1 Tax=Paenibacillus sp. J31TS4 TaxID=2807195 RepID=UPI001B1E6FFA|nr:MraY family glycosyltransferase [Paenibacillus sp. J31TS4]GIP40287.1 undecaprenyl-phosphate alpha-N-acetylglucosaminyl 1-phosphate transferase [Paenibacillus sp. J31TS4]
MTLGWPLAASFLAVLVLVPIIRKAALRLRFVDLPTKRKAHQAPVPLMGGLAIYLGFMAVLFAREGWTSFTAALATGGTLLLLTGLLDDYYKSKGREFPVWPRLLVYLIASTVPLWYGIGIEGITNPYGQGMLFFPVWLVWLSTAAWVFGITNMINFIDGVDGLAAGITAISSITLMIISLWKDQPDSAVVAAILAGACLAFLLYNFHPAKIFMGDAGAIFLGYTLALVAIHGAFKSATFLSVLVPLLALGVPIMDTVIVFARRFKEHKGLHRADKLHTHHALMKWGLTQTQTVSFLYLIGALFSLLSLLVLLVNR